MLCLKPSFKGRFAAFPKLYETTGNGTNMVPITRFIIKLSKLIGLRSGKAWTLKRPLYLLSPKVYIAWFYREQQPYSRHFHPFSVCLRISLLHAPHSTPPEFSPPKHLFQTAQVTKVL